MAVEPLFVENLARLKSNLRMTGAVQTDTNTAIDRAMQKVRIGITRRLGSGPVATIAAITYNENPATTDEITRALANNLETDWVKLLLVQELPMLFMDSSGSTEQVWNTEELTRSAGSDNQAKLIAYLEDEVEDALVTLEGDTPSDKVQGFNVEADIDPPIPGGSVRTNTSMWGSSGGVI